MNQALAQNLQLPGGTNISGPQGLDFGSQITIGSILSKAIPIIFAFAGIGLLLMILAAGFTLLTSAGDAKKMEQGKNQLTFAIVGFIIIFAAFWIVRIFGTIFGFETITNIF